MRGPVFRSDCPPPLPSPTSFSRLQSKSRSSPQPHIHDWSQEAIRPASLITTFSPLLHQGQRQNSCRSKLVSRGMTANGIAWRRSRGQMRVDHVIYKKIGGLSTGSNRWASASDIWLSASRKYIDILRALSELDAFNRKKANQMGSIEWEV